MDCGLKLQIAPKAGHFHHNFRCLHTGTKFLRRLPTARHNVPMQ